VGRTTATYSGGLAGIKPPKVEHAAGLFCKDTAQCFPNGMNILKVKSVTVFATDVWFDEDMLRIQLSDGHEIGVPHEQFPKLRDATDEQLGRYRRGPFSSGIIGILSETIVSQFLIAIVCKLRSDAAL
jgi:hypothetical protein